MKFDIHDIPDGPFKDLEDLNKAIAAHIEKVNNSARDDFHGLSPSQMYLLLHEMFRDDSPLKVKPVTSAQIEKMPFIRLVMDLVNAVQVAGGVKATAKGNLPPAVCKELYAKKHILHEMLELGITKGSKEEDFPSIHVAHIVAELTGLVRTIKGKILVTKKAERLFETAHLPELFQQLLEVFCIRYSWGYIDGIAHEEIVQSEKGFLIYLLVKFGNIDHTAAFYAEKCMTAFPLIKDHLKSRYQTPMQELALAVEIRFLDHFALWFGLVEVVGEEKHGYLTAKIYRKTGLFDAVFGFTL